MTTEQARELMHQWITNPALRVHMECVAACMGSYARQLAPADEERWRVCGLLHDMDWEKHPTREEHPFVAVKFLRERGEADLAHAVSAHYTRWGVPYDHLLDKALLASDEVTGFVMACALVRPNRTEGLEPKSVKKKLKDKAFAAGVDRFEVTEGFRMLIEAVGGTEDEHLARIIAVLHGHREELGLA